MNLLRKIQYSQYWNIGFCEQTPEELIHDKQLKPVKWLKHPYRDRWFADPFIFRVTEDEIVVFVEECLIEHPKGRICELVIDRKSQVLKNRYLLLELDTHLSYPAFLELDGKVYVYPENGASGQLNIYEYDERSHRLINPICILCESVADATIHKIGDVFYMSATKFPKTQENVFLFKSSSILGPFEQVSEAPFQISREYSRQGGNWFTVSSNLYRPAQDCITRYGSALSIMKSSIEEETINEELIFKLRPDNNSFNLGLHTINFERDICVIDGYGYLYPFLGRIYYSKIFRRIIGIIKRF